MSLIYCQFKRFLHVLVFKRKNNWLLWQLAIEYCHIEFVPESVSSSVTQIFLLKLYQSTFFIKKLYTCQKKCLVLIGLYVCVNVLIRRIKTSFTENSSMIYFLFQEMVRVGFRPPGDIPLAILSFLCLIINGKIYTGRYSILSFLCLIVNGKI